VFPVKPLAMVCLSILWIAVLLSENPIFGQPRFPQLTGRVVDEAGLLSPADREALAEELQKLDVETTNQVVIYTTTSLQGYTIEDFGYQLGRTWQIGQKGKDNGVLLIVAPNQRQVRIEVGYGLEPRLTDLACKLIIENSILPAFRRGDYPGGIKAGVRDIRGLLLGKTQTIEKVIPKNDFSFWDLIATIAFIFLLIAANFGIMLAGARSYVGGSSPGRVRSIGGGGFSGGGGSFGGGGASGRW
jgi:uncharacterized protein